MDEAFLNIYKEIKAKWNEFRKKECDPEILKFLIHLMEEIEEEILKE